MKQNILNQLKKICIQCQQAGIRIGYREITWCEPPRVEIVIENTIIENNQIIFRDAVSKDEKE